MEMPTPQSQRATLITEPFDMVVFGGRGDLARRKLLPALYELDRDNRLPPDGRIIAVSRGAMSPEEFHNLVQEAVTEFLTKGEAVDPEMMVRVTGNENLRTVAEEAAARLRAAIESLR